MLAVVPDSVVVPTETLAPTLPASTALTVPPCRSYAVVLVNTPVVPVIVPAFFKITPATVSLKPPTSRIAVAPSTVTVLALLIAFAVPNASVPAFTLVAPV